MLSGRLSTTEWQEVCQILLPRIVAISNVTNNKETTINGNLLTQDRFLINTKNNLLNKIL